MCLGGIAQLVEAWEDDGARVGQARRRRRRLARVRPRCARRRDVLVHLGVPVEVLEPTRRRALALRRSRRARRSPMTSIAATSRCVQPARPESRSRSHRARQRRRGLRERAGRPRFGDATVYTTAKNAVGGRAAPPARAASARRATCARVPIGSPAHSRRTGSVSSRSPCIGGSVPFVLFFEGLSRATATQAAFIHKTLVVWVALLAVPLLRERLGAGARRWRSCCSWPARPGSPGDAGTLVFGAGEAMILAATLLWAVEVILVKRLVAGSTPRTLAAARMALGAVVLVAWVAVSGRAGDCSASTASSGAGRCSPGACSPRTSPPGTPRWRARRPSTSRRCSSSAPS